jgi:hypothetical protein
MYLTTTVFCVNQRKGSQKRQSPVTNSYHWCLETFGYESKEQLLGNIKAIILDRALAKHNELRIQKAEKPRMLTLADLQNK